LPTINWMEMLQGRIADKGNEKPSRISRMNRSGMRLHFAAAVTDCGDDGCKPLSSASERCLGFAVQLTHEDCDCDRTCMPSRGFYAPGESVRISQNDRIFAVSPCDVFTGDSVFVHPISGLPASCGIEVQGATWQSEAMSGETAVIQIDTKGRRRP
jgi:hypothetical protein